MRKKVVKVGIMPLETFQKYTMAIARGKYKPNKNEPKIWFESIETCMQVLSTRNIDLLKMIEKEKPASIDELSKISGRNKGNLSRTLKTFYRHRLIDFIEEDRRKRPVALSTRFDIQVGRNLPDFMFDKDAISQMGETGC
ncbi:MAG: transcriptional regulator [Deltaproteobacteria bacterium]|nr:transcriptional regulator [Deltaproteobacteria bacterium]